ncbi:MAG: SDR family NAD(P)-dependent oxidoreductase [Isosphaeraceae bacterium]
MSISIDLTGSTALVTGASQGMGAEIARVLHRAGARVVVNHPDQGEGKTRAGADALRDELLALRKDSAMVQIADVRDAAAVQVMMQKIRQDWGGLDILVNNAGILRQRSIAKMSLDEWRDVVDIDLSGVFYCCKYGLEILRDGGSIVCVGSLAARIGFHGQSSYSAAKAGVEALVRVLARECAHRGIRVNAVAPGFINTAMIADARPAARDQFTTSLALGRLGEPGEVAAAVLFLCSPLASYITRHVLAVDGGFLG